MTLEPSEAGRNEEFDKRPVPFRIVLAMQGGGALGAYHCGVYEALQEHGLEPDWIIGTSIGALNGAIIAGNPVERRIERLRAFWNTMATRHLGPWSLLPDFLNRHVARFLAMTIGVPGFYAPNPALALGWRTPVGTDHAALYSAAPLAETIARLVDVERLNSGTPRFSFNLVHVARGTLHYLDNRSCEISLRHILAAAAMPPSFPPVRIDGEPYWDAGFYSNTPLAAAFEDKSGCNSIIFAPSLWPTAGAEPQSLAEAWSREKSIGFASRVDDQVARQVHLHRLRHVIRRLIDMLPDDKKESLRERDFERVFLGPGGGAQIHVVQLNGQGPDQDDPFRDIDFTLPTVNERWRAGHDDTCRILEQRFWEEPVALVNGVAVHRWP